MREGEEEKKGEGKRKRREKGKVERTSEPPSPPTPVSPAPDLLPRAQITELSGDNVNEHHHVSGIEHP